MAHAYNLSKKSVLPCLNKLGVVGHTCGLSYKGGWKIIWQAYGRADGQQWSTKPSQRWTLFTKFSQDLGIPALVEFLLISTLEKKI
jgi:hypothetical protein